LILVKVGFQKNQAHFFDENQKENNEFCNLQNIYYFSHGYVFELHYNPTQLLVYWSGKF